ncbi:unnamed protein product [Camellia sinensis]
MIGFIGVLGTSLLTLHISHLEDSDTSPSPLIYGSVARMTMGMNGMTIPWPPKGMAIYTGNKNCSSTHQNQLLFNA